VKRCRISGDGREAAAETVSLAGEILHVIADAAFAPGTPLSLAIEELERTAQGKTIGSKRRDDGRYDVRLRLVSSRREDRGKLV
jgi:hypothetical protein